MKVTKLLENTFYAVFKTHDMWPQNLSHHVKFPFQETSYTVYIFDLSHITTTLHKAIWLTCLQKGGIFNLIVCCCSQMILLISYEEILTKRNHHALFPEMYFVRDNENGAHTWQVLLMNKFFPNHRKYEPRISYFQHQS